MMIHGSWRSLDRLWGLRKMPAPMVMPMISAVPPQKPMTRRRSPPDDAPDSAGAGTLMRRSLALERPDYNECKLRGGGTEPMKHAAWILMLLSACASPRPSEMSDGSLTLHARRGEKTETVSWKPAETGLIICDMWDTHTCAGAARRVAEMAP